MFHQIKFRQRNEWGMTTLELLGPLGNIEVRFLSRRLELGWSQLQLADLLEISRPHVSGIERGVYWPHPSTLELIQTTLGIDSAKFLTLNRPPKKGCPHCRNEAGPFGAVDTTQYVDKVLAESRSSP